DQGRGRRRRLLLLHVLLGGASPGQDADGGLRQADRRDDDPDRLLGRLRAGASRRGRDADHHPGRHRHLVRAQLHRQGLRPGEGVMRLPLLSLALVPVAATAQTQGWGDLGKPEEKGFSWTAPLWPDFWMAWT